MYVIVCWTRASKIKPENRAGGGGCRKNNNIVARASVAVYGKDVTPRVGVVVVDTQATSSLGIRNT